jgi:membrane protease YdiL (CAAX protease family)
MARVSFEGVRRAGIALAWILLFFVIGFGLTIGLAQVLPGWGGPGWQLTRNVLYELIGFGTATVIVGRVLNQHSWDQMGWHGGGLARRVVRGTALGAAMAALAIGLALVGDHASVSMVPEWGRWLEVALPLAFVLLVAALAEELAFRGYPLRRLSEGVGRLPAMAVLAVAFGFAHVGNPSATVFSTINVALAAVWLSFAFFSPGGMGLAWGLHFGWNAGLALLFDAPVSGYRFQIPAVEYAPGPRAWVDGGAFGPEGGMVATIVVIAGTLALVGVRFKQPREWLVG